MKFNFLKIILSVLIYLTIFITSSSSEIVKEIKISGNDRISDDTIKMFSQVSIDQNLNSTDINSILKKLFNTNFFKDVSVSLNNEILKIIVVENPIIQNINYDGIKAKKIKDEIKNSLKLKPRFIQSNYT